MKIAADSCAGVNIGELAYHQGIALLFPDSIVTFVNLREHNQAIDIGGVGNGTSLTITHAVVYRLPTTFEGQEACLSFSLSKDAAASALVGIAFFQKTRAIMSFSNPDDPVLMLQNLGLNLPITFEQPTLRPPPKRQEVSKNYLAMPPLVPAPGKGCLVNLPAEA